MNEEAGKRFAPLKTITSDVVDNSLDGKGQIRAALAPICGRLVSLQSRLKFEMDQIAAYAEMGPLIINDDDLNATRLATMALADRLTAEMRKRGFDAF